MWVLSTDRAELYFFPSPGDIPGGFTTLSHTWGDDEQSFQDVKEICEDCKRTGANPRDHVSTKIRNCCVLAENYGYKWVWIDSSCIDKTSSSDLSEAINSMFRWYSQAEVCYAYLADVPDDCTLEAPDSAFRKSRWHKRGWTLQELIAPAAVIFVSQSWQRQLGNKYDLASLLCDITGIPQNILTRDASFSSCGVAQRMSWASHRSTTRVEDEAYCLMGLFGVNMPTIYGEGRKAFQRLQEEIMKVSSDTSLFAWGSHLRAKDLASWVILLGYYEKEDRLSEENYLLAPSPRAFRGYGGTSYTPDLSDTIQPHIWSRKTMSDDTDSVEEVRSSPSPASTSIPRHTGSFVVPKFAATSLGVEAHLPIVEAFGYTVALLLCRKGDEHLGLLLSTIQSPSVASTQPLYRATMTFREARRADRLWGHSRRIVSLGNDPRALHIAGKPVSAAWRTVCILRSPPDWVSPDAVYGRLTVNRRVDGAFRLPHWLIAKFAALGFLLNQAPPPPPNATSESDFEPHRPLRLYFGNSLVREHLFLDLGVCEIEIGIGDGDGDGERLQPGTPRRWARAILNPDVSRNAHAANGPHSCAEDHVDAWERLTKTFGDERRRVKVTFVPCAVSSDTLVVHLELFGAVYERMLREARITFPSLQELSRPPATLAAHSRR